MTQSAALRQQRREHQKGHDQNNSVAGTISCLCFYLLYYGFIVVVIYMMKGKVDKVAGEE
jgi:hypothetical protein